MRFPVENALKYVNVRGGYTGVVNVKLSVHHKILRRK